MAGETHDGRSAATPATGIQVPTREQLRARWTCDCELLGLVRPRRPGSHTAAAVLCSERRKAGAEDDGSGVGWRMGQVVGVLVPAMTAQPREFPKTVHKLWIAMSEDQRPGASSSPLVTFAMCLKARRRPNPEWAQLEDDASKADGRAIGKTILVPEPWESWAIRARDVRGVWGGWSGEAPKPESFRIRRVRNADGLPQLTYQQVLKYVKTGAIE